MIRYRGEEVWAGEQHVANLRIARNQELPYVVQAVTGEICFRARSRRVAEVWVGVHSEELLRRLLVKRD